jgi:predicted RNA-binding Zn-ribbon protein involved in translation (DUF1610 family)
VAKAKPKIKLVSVKLACPACGVTNLGLQTQCIRCGAMLPTAVPRLCPGCRATNIGAQSQCLTCGATLPALPSPPTPPPLESPQTGTRKAAPVCAMCGGPLTPGRAFCTRCGHPIGGSVAPTVNPTERRCPNCGQVVPAGRKFCTADGTPVP